MQISSKSKIVKISSDSNNIFPKKNCQKYINAPILYGDKSELKLNRISISINYEFIKNKKN